MNRVTSVQLDQVRKDIHAYMPAYNIKRVDPFEALRVRVGNCASKCAVASSLLVARYGVEPAVAYSEKLHGTERQGMISSSRTKQMVHITTLAIEAARAEAPERVLSLCFGIEGKSGKKVFEDDEGDILDYNETLNLARIGDDGSVLPTAEALDPEVQLYVGNWRDGINKYLTTLDRDPIDTDQLVEQVATAFGERVA